MKHNHTHNHNNNNNFKNVLDVSQTIKFVLYTISYIYVSLLIVSEHVKDQLDMGTPLPVVDEIVSK